MNNIDSVKINFLNTQMASKPHHHGNLREALIRAGLGLLEEGGINALTLRQCAVRAGVSHAAPAHHFNGLISLKAAIVARGYRIFTDTMNAAKQNAKDDPRSQLLAICKGYLKFATENRAVFDLMFAPRDEIDPQIDEVTLKELGVESGVAYQVLHDACQPFEHTEVGERGTETMVWSLVHGYATLFSHRKKRYGSADELPDFEKILPKLTLRAK